MAAIAYTILQLAIIASQGKDSILKKAVGKDIKGKISVTFYLSAFIVAVWVPLLAQLFYVIVALIWLIPDKRIERVLQSIED